MDYTPGARHESPVGGYIPSYKCDQDILLTPALSGVVLFTNAEGNRPIVLTVFYSSRRPFG